MRLLTAGLVLLAASEASGASAPDLTFLRERVRKTLTAHCGFCHVPTLPTAQPGALRAFRLDELDWAKGMTGRQLRAAARMLRDRITMRTRELSYLLPKGVKAPSPPSLEEVSELDRYVAEERALRLGLPSAPLDPPASSRASSIPCLPTRIPHAADPFAPLAFPTVPMDNSGNSRSADDLPGPSLPTR